MQPLEPLGAGTKLGEAVEREREQMERRTLAYRGTVEEPTVAGLDVALVDDGLATGASMRAAVGWSESAGAASVRVVVPVAAPATVADFARSGRGPVIISAETFRMGGHATHDEKEARRIFPPGVFEYWGKRDPIGMYESYLERHGVTRGALQEVEDRVIEEIAIAEREALASRENSVLQASSATSGVYAEPD